DADENGAAIEYATAKQQDITARGFGITIKSRENAGIYLGYAWTDEPEEPKVKSYSVGYEHYVASKTSTQVITVFIPSAVISRTSLPYDMSITSLLPGAAMGFVAPLWGTGRNVTAAGISLSIPISTSLGIESKTTTNVFASSTVAFRVTPKVMVAGGVTYSDSNAEGSVGTLEYKVGLLFATKMIDTN
ncbi:MAG: hypothetical protein GY867_00070, partial [bacterium]|nr:hypothetical protein [bacterium]